MVRHRRTRQSVDVVHRRWAACCDYCELTASCTRWRKRIYIGCPNRVATACCRWWQHAKPTRKRWRPWPYKIFAGREEMKALVIQRTQRGKKLKSWVELKS